MSNLWQWCKNSTFQLVININPINWIFNPLYFETFNEENFKGFHLKILPFRLSLILSPGIEDEPADDWGEDEEYDLDKYFEDLDVVDPDEMIVIDKKKVE